MSAIPAFVINLDQSPARLAHMQRVLGALAIDFVRLRAVNAPDVALHPARSCIPDMAHRPWADAELGCLLSHYEAWQRIASGPWLYAAVFEDDVHLAPGLVALLDDTVPPPGTDLLKLETTHHLVRVSRLSRPGPAGMRFARMLSFHQGCAAYIISREAAARLCSALGEFDLPVDDVLFSPAHRLGRSLLTYQVVPAAAEQDVFRTADRRIPELGSTIEADRRLAAASSAAPAAHGSRNRLLPLATLPQRLVGAAWRRLWWRFAAVPYAGDVSQGTVRQ